VMCVVLCVVCGLNVMSYVLCLVSPV